MDTDFDAEARALTRGWRWKCCPCCPDDMETNLHPDPPNQHTVPCDHREHMQDSTHGRTRLREGI